MNLDEFYKRQALRKKLNKKFVEEEGTEIPLFFHGTDAKVLRMTESERAELKNACLAIIDYLWNFFKEHQVNNLLEYRKQLGEVLWYNLNVACTCNHARLENNSLYQYGDLYLTNHPARARSYAIDYDLYGEIGNIAKTFYEAAVVLNIKFDNMPQKDSGYLDVFINALEKEPEPIVCALKNINLDLLQNEQGEDFDWEMDFDTIFGMETIDSFIYTKKYDLNNSIIIPLDNFASELEKLGYIVDGNNTEYIEKSDNECYKDFIEYREKTVKSMN